MKANNIIFKSIIIIINITIALTGAANLEAAFLRNVEISLQQPNGEIINCFASGDENYNWLHDENGYVIIKDGVTGCYVYAEKEFESLVPSAYIVNSINPSSLGIQPNQIDDVKMREVKFNLKDKYNNNDNKIQSGAIDEFSNLVIFIRFADENEFVNNINYYDEIFNSKEKLSVLKYYLDASYNTITINSNLIKAGKEKTNISYKASKPRNYYMEYNATTNPNGWTSNYQSTSRLKNLLSETIQNVKSQIPGNLNLDKNNDGAIDNITFIVSGEPEGWSSILWPHMWNIGKMNIYINNKLANIYNFQLESYVKVGVLCHEMFHSLGAPDLYHYEDDYNPVGIWDLMADTDYDNPQQMGAYMKYRYGNWINDIPVINKSGIYSLKPITEKENNCFRINSPYSKNEYFVIEYRSKNKETSLPGEGLIIYRINLKNDGKGNAYADGDDEVYIFRQNGSLTKNGNIKNANFSNNVNRTVFNNQSNPQPFLSIGTVDDSFTIFDISNSGSVITFKVQIGDVPVIEPNTSSVDDFDENNNNIKLYPNPSTQFFNIENNELNNRINKVALYNSDGKFIKNDYFNNSNYIKINVNDLHVGYYNVYIYYSDKIIQKSIFKN